MPARYTSVADLRTQTVPSGLDHGLKTLYGACVLLAWISHSVDLSHRQRQTLDVGVFLKLGKFSVFLRETPRVQVLLCTDSPHTHAFISLGENE